MDQAFEYVFPAIRGIQANREFYVSQCPLRLIPKLFLFDEEELVPELRAQRTLNRARIPEMAEYVVSNRDDYVFSALTASIDAEIKFEPLGQGGQSSRIGLLHIPMAARFIINDGQHRRAAIEIALRDDSSIGDESIAVVFFVDLGLARSQQMFADLNRHAVRPSKSLGVLYDHRDEMAEVTRLAVFRSTFFRDIVETEKSTLSPRSRKLFTLSAIYTGTSALLGQQAFEEGANLKELAVTAQTYWEEVARHFPEWRLAHERKMTAAEIRRDFIHSHGVVLHALGTVGNRLFREYPDTWGDRLKGLSTIDWSRSNPLWEGRAMLGGRVSKARQNLLLTTSAIKSHLGLMLDPEEVAAEQAIQRGSHDNN